jgi:REP element-mobilizing transposase RayT
VAPGDERDDNGPLAFFLTFTTYGTWLHGDPRGSIDRSNDAYGQLWLEPSPARLRYEQRFRLTSPAVRLDHTARAAVTEAIAHTCDLRGWSLLALNARTNHVHAVVRAPVPPEKILTALKANATRRLAELQIVLAGARVWTRHGSTRYWWKESDVRDACAYVIEGQGSPPGF